MSIFLAEPPIATERYSPAVEDVVLLTYDTDDVIAFWERCLSWSGEPEFGTIDELEDGYTVLQPIPYRIEQQQDGSFVASFSEANIAIAGTDRTDAYQSLVAEILDTYDTLAAEPVLGPVASAQRALLETYLVKA